MAHELTMTKEGASMAYAGDIPWHGLGKKVPNDLTPQQMLEAAQLDWEVDLRPVHFKNSAGEFVESQHNSVLVKVTDDKPLSIVSRDWQPVQNLEAFEFFHDFVMAGDMDMETAGSLQNDKMVWALAKIKESFTINGHDQVDSYLLFSNPHEYGKSINIRFTPVRVCCRNTLSIALSGKSDLQVKLNHRKAFDPDQAKNILGITSNKLQEYKESAEFLSGKLYSKSTVEEFFNRVFPIPETKSGEPSKMLRDLRDILNTQPGAEFAPGSWWNAFNAVTYYVDHKASKQPSRRLNEAWYGLGRLRKNKALKEAIEMAEVA